jgi:hypothetical protein
MTQAHDQRMTLHLIAHVPAHEPREDDPHYHLFEQVKARMKRQDLWKCVMNDDYCGGDVELHHSHVEFSQTNGVDLAKLNDQLGLHIASDEDFQKWIESPGNLEPLCTAHHRTHFGVHVIPGPLWEPLRYRKAGIAPSAEFVTADEAAADPANTVEATTVKTTTTRRRPTVRGVRTDTSQDVKTDVKVTAPDHHTVEERVEHKHTEDRTTVTRPRKKPEKGFFGRLFGRD